MDTKNPVISACYETVLILYNILFLLAKISCSFARCTLCRTVVFCATSAILGLLFKNTYHLVACLSNTLREVMAFRIILQHAASVMHFLFSGRPRRRVWPGVAGCGQIRVRAAGFFRTGCSTQRQTLLLRAAMPKTGHAFQAMAYRGDH